MFSLRDLVQIKEEIKDDINGHVKKGAVGYITDIARSGSFANVVIGNKTIMVNTKRLNIVKKAKTKRRYQKRK